MRRLCAAAFTIWSAPPAFAEEPPFPARKPGLWEQTIIHKGGAGETTLTRICLGEAEDARLWALSPGLALCPKRIVAREGEALTVQMDCLKGHVQIKAKAMISGDYAALYETLLTTEAALEPKAGRIDKMLAAASEGERVIAMRRLGECPKGAAPGDVFDADGEKTLNLLKAAEKAESADE